MIRFLDDKALVSVDRLVALAHTSRNCPRRLRSAGFVRQSLVRQSFVGNLRLRKICGCASIQAVSLRENTRRSGSRFFAGDFFQPVRQPFWQP
jgi:hypothetical protein